MRTRFLNTDYFNSVPIQALETLEFLRLPFPHLPPSNISNFHDLRCCFDDVSPLSVSLEIDKLPIDNALSKFFSHVVPHIIDVAIEDSANFSSQTIVEVRTSVEENESIFYGKGDNDFEIVQFEMPELDLSLENAGFSQKEKMQIFSEVSDAETSTDMLNPTLRVQHLFEIQESIFSVEDIRCVYHVEQKADLLEDGGLVQGQNHPYHGPFPLLEVDETSLGIFSCRSVEDEFLLLDNIEPQHWRQNDEVMGSGKELLHSMKVDILEYLLDHCLSNQCLEAEISCSNFVQEVDLISFIEHSAIEGNSSFHRGRPDDGSNWSMNPILFEEFQFFYLNSSQCLEVFSNSATICEAETCEQMFGEAMNFRNFNELIVSHELTLADDSFKSFPVPILSDHEKKRSVPAFLEETLAELKPQPSSASDGIYLDWHLLDEDYWNCGKYSSYWKILVELDTSSIDFDLTSIDGGILVFDFVISDESLNEPTTEDNREILHILPCCSSHVCPNEVASSMSWNDGNKKCLNVDVSSNINAEKVSSLLESMSQFNDLDFFLNPLESTTGKHHEPVVRTFDLNATFPGVSSGASIAACATGILQLHQWDIKLHQIKLSDDILSLIDNFQKNYLAILENYTELTKTEYSSVAVDHFTLFTLPKHKLMDCIKKTSAQRTSLASDDDNIMAFVTLCAIKQMAWYLCYYGIHTTYLYIDKLCRSLQYLKFRLSFLQDLIVNAHWKADKDIRKSHPSLSIIHDILHSNQSSSKILVVAEQLFWWPLKELLTSMKISYSEPQNFYTNTSQHDVCYNSEFTDTAMDAVLSSDCCLVSHEHVSASFPFDKFGIILEYGGSCGSSRVSTISPTLVGFPILHFLKVELEDLSFSKALCEGVDFPKNIGFTMKGDPHSIPALNERNQKLEQLLNFIPVEDYNTGSLEAADEVKTCSKPVPVPCVPVATETNRIFTSMPSFPEAIIIVNTQNSDGEMIISRRSTYQRILAMEKEGTQVVERDLSLPVDIIISAAVCLAWYDCRNIGKKATAPNEGSSCLPLCVENIAANVLTLLSFTFSGCILVFEGESCFLAGVMESSDELYAAAASLGINLQLFCSYSSEMTDEIILSCIGHTSKLTRGLYPEMPESETLAESFLTTFPSVNPLSAHAILSSGGMLVEFLECSHAHRIRAVQKYYVPDESVTLLSAFCKYGEREDSKSGTTDCSSSISSAPDSKYYHCKTYSEKKKRKYNGSPHNIDKPIDDLFHFEPLKLFTDDGRPTVMSKSYNSWPSKGPERFNEIAKSSASFNDKLLAQKQGSNINMTTNPSRLSNPCDFQKSKGDELSDERENLTLPMNNALFDQKGGPDMNLMNILNGRNNKHYGSLQGDFIGEVIDIDDSSPSGKGLSSANTSGFLPSAPEMEKDPAARISRTARKLSFDMSSLPTFPTAAEICSDLDAWIPIDCRQNSREGINQDPDKDFNTDNMPLKHQKNFLGEGNLLKTATNFHKPSFQEEDIQHYGGTPLSNAIRLAQPQQGSPWTIEFLNRIREKSRLRQQSLPPDLSAPCFGYSGNISKFSKRKSPSILDFYKYQGGSTPKKIIAQKRQKRSTQPSSSSKNEKTLPSFLPQLTPSDKRARQALSFATNGRGGQSKLVWGDKSAHALNRRF